VVGKVAEADAIRALCELRRPGVVIVDAGCRLGEIALLMRSLLRSFPELSVLIGSGHSVPEIADLLGISSLRVENLKRSVYAKLDVSSGAQAVSRLTSLGMLDRRAQARPSRARPPRASRS
jgi:uncharacterized protein with ACT and thioredoxin-like domain